MSTSERILFILLVCFDVSAKVIASHWKVFAKTVSSSEYEVRNVGTLKIIVSDTKNPVLWVRGRSLEIDLNSLPYSEEIDFHSGFLAASSENKLVNVVFDCFDNESVVFVPLILNQDPELIRLDKIDHNGCDGS